MASKKSVVSARQRAHQALAAHRQERIAREKANEADLVAFLLLEQQIGEAGQTYRHTISALRHQQGVHLRQWRDRGERLSAIADLTGRSVAELGRVIKSATAPNRTQQPNSAAPLDLSR
ncbi:hypothetical protein HLB23_24390 [Nocardia uniformis]|uniref:Uncharacterized protein n=1 Tax=Nocardia uniformis TaxID=53432 RepID=A0A849C9B3_9NOCA|nr:hypothetical protein [Nocardia uniformis]NNH72960.1 hypothetical protein [Nocardia uniformis]